MVKILITNTTVITMSTKGELVLRDAYLYIDKGVVKALGTGEVPIEYQYAEYLINGKGRIVLPGFVSGFTLVTPYLIRYEVSGLNDPKIKDLLSVVSRDDVYYIAVLAFTEMVKKGVTAALVVDTYLDSIARAADAVGIRAVLAPGAGCVYTQEDVEHSLKLIMNRYHGRLPNICGGVATCKEELIPHINRLAYDYGIRGFLINTDPKKTSVSMEVPQNMTLINATPMEGGAKAVFTEEFISSWRAPAGVGLGVKASYDVSDLIKRLVMRGVSMFDALAAGTVWGYEALGLPFSSSIEVGKPCDIVILNASEPPGWPTPKSLESLFRAVIEGSIPVETVIVADNIVVDYGETVTVGSDIIRKATKRLSDLLEKKLLS